MVEITVVLMALQVLLIEVTAEEVEAEVLASPQLQETEQQVVLVLSS